MTVRITTGPRASGKTTRLIVESAKTGATIVEPSRWMADYVKDMAKSLGMVIPEPVAITQLLVGGVRRTGRRVLIDELDMCFRALGMEVVEATMCEEETRPNA